VNRRMNENASLDDIRRVLLENDRFVIAAHFNPDSDAVGSCLALGLGLKKLGKNVHVVLDSYHEKNRVIPGQELVLSGTSDEPGASVFIVLDCANAERVSDRFAYMGRAETLVCVDHHLSNSRFTRYAYLDSDASSTCELIYRLISPIIDLDPDIAAALYAGVVTDTGGFRHGCTSPETLRVAAGLLSYGIPFTDIYNTLLSRHSLTETRVLRAALNNLELLKHNRLAVSFISSGEMDNINADITDTDGISEYMLNITGVEVSVFLYEKIINEIKASMRSSKINLSGIAVLFGGGGHKYAAGCTIKDALPEALKRLTAAVSSAMETV